MSAIMIDPVEGWLVEQVVEPVTGRTMLHVTIDGGEVDPADAPVLCTTPAGVLAVMGLPAFQRLAAPPAGVPMCEVL